MEQEILTSPQKTAIEIVAKEFNLKNCYLSGGTALAAFYLKHRLSDDLDFFSFEGFDSTFLHDFIDRLKNILNADSVRFDKLFDRNIFFLNLKDGELKIEFTKYPFKQLDEPVEIDGIKVDSLRDVSANKLMTLLDRFDPKDFVDLFFILQNTTLEKIRKDAEKKFDTKIENIFLGSELAKVRRIEGLPKMKKSLELFDLKEFFEKQARQLGQEIFSN